ncbi:hypothetical protein QTL95_17260 [Rhizobium sp. S152]|uniref:hypothetical protein n=1 Tax=Rhizobium sp. S152 TaxID=3055038 RepID=UPI0025A995CE|nr:hypothetical protein [Rhizobium sp. S152]MDM9627653.1 hypothetical protein [Rhizobium sp. S152]
MSERQSLSQEERRKKLDETHQVALAIIDEQRRARDAKTLRLRQLRLAMESEVDNQPARERDRLTKK